jgi:hypothetical protein
MRMPDAKGWLNVATPSFDLSAAEQPQPNRSFGSP